MTWGLFAPRMMHEWLGTGKEKIRTSPSFCPQQTLGSFIHSRVFQVSLQRGLTGRVIKSSQE
uniref:Uncharacterized protein n=1 Tax=Capra hircus TaxID=9925 RepID=A0A452FN49_CAPHI